VRRVAIVALLMVPAMFLWAPAAQAHANLESSEPADGAILATAPDRVTLTFTEPPDPQLSSVQVLDAAGAQVQQGKAQPVPGDDHSLQVGLPSDLPDGVYTVSWVAVSETDGHLTSRAFAFGVGVAGTHVMPVPGAGGSGTPFPSVLSVAGRVALYVGLSLLFAAGAIGLLVFGGAVPGGRRTLVAGAVLATLGSVAIVAAERSTLGVGLGDLLGSNTGGPLVRVVVAAFVAAAVAVLVARRRNRGTLLALAAAAAAAMLMRAWAGHAGGAALQITFQWGHILAIGAWIGGLALLSFRLRSTRDGDAPIGEIRRFSLLAGWALLVVVVTGSLRAINELGGIGEWRRLFDEAYGITLLIKVAVAAVLIALGATNRYRNIPALERGERPSTFANAVRAEVLLALGIFALTGVFTGLPPLANGPTHGHTRPASLVVTGSDFATTVRVRLTITPGPVGPNTFRVDALDYDSGAPLPADRVSLRFEPLGDPGVGPSTLELAATGDAWQATGTQLSLVGPWRVTVLVQQPSGAVDIPLQVRPRVEETVTVARSADLPDITTITLPGGVSVQCYADPGRPGPNEFHATFFDPKGAELPIAKLAVLADGPDAGPQALEVQRLTPGHFAADVELSAGDWTFDVSATTQAGDTLVASYDQTIGA
jgi:copper transport protein